MATQHSPAPKEPTALGNTPPFGEGAPADERGARKLLERRPSATPGIEADAFQRKAGEVADAQRRGDVSQEMAPDDLLTMVLAAAQGWFWAAEGVAPEEFSRSWPAQRPAQHRAAVVEAARRLTERNTSGEWPPCAVAHRGTPPGSCDPAPSRIWDSRLRLPTSVPVPRLRAVVVRCTGPVCSPPSATAGRG
ncbi:hypothetical protein ABT072_45325 [Streptomyces sp. NPDC002589]|uniref:hypothetical protein n=1 Tax=Streptomyces sp. NPDC002589 TaxID=3154420 RepID=UPI003320D391